MLGSLLAVVHVGLLALWLGAMLYSLLVVQPRATRFFTDDDSLEEFLTALGAGNRRPVLAIVIGLFASGGLLAATQTWSAARAGMLAAEGVALLAAAALFARVSWQLWPRRLFALPDERAAHRAALRHHAWAMIGLVGASFVLAVSALT